VAASTLFLREYLRIDKLCLNRFLKHLLFIWTIDSSRSQLLHYNLPLNGVGIKMEEFVRFFKLLIDVQKCTPHAML